MIEETGQEALQFLSKVAEILPLILFVYDTRRDEVIFFQSPWQTSSSNRNARGFTRRRAFFTQPGQRGRPTCFCQLYPPLTTGGRT